MKPRTYHLARLALVFLGALAVAMSLRVSAYRFGSFDLAPLIDSGWRVVSGQVPGRDFVNTVPASLYLFTATLFRHLGVSWHALGIGAGVIFGAFLLLGLRVAGLLRSTLGERDAVFVSAIYFVAQTIPLISINYPWHAWMSQGFATYAALICFALLQHGDSSRLRRIELFIHLAVALTGLVLSKPNVSYPAAALCIAVLLLAGVSKRFVWCAFAVAVISSALLLHTAHVSLPGMLGAYSGLGSRALPKMLFLGTLWNISLIEGMAAIPVFAAIASLCSLLAVLGWRNRSGLLRRPMDLLGFGCIVLAWIGFGTNADDKLTDTPALLVGALVLVLAASFPTGNLRGRLIWTSLGLLYLAFFAGLTRQRMQTIGMWADEGCGPRVVLHDRFFGTLHDCRTFGNVLDEMDRTLSPLPPGTRVFLGPNLEFAYARNRLPSPPHLPTWWDPGTSFPRSQVHQISEAWTADHFDRVIFVHGLRVNVPQEILDQVDREYIQLPGTELIDVYRHR